MKRALLPVLFLMAAGFGGWVLMAKHAHKLPAMPDLNRRTSEAKPTTEFLKAQEQVKKYRQMIQDKPENLENYVRLSYVYLDESRITAAHHIYIPIAEGIVDAALDRNPKYFDAMVTKAGILMTKHDFEQANTLVQSAVAINPYNSGSYGILCDANVELGNYPAAVTAADSMMQKRPDLRSYARVSYQREIHGDMPGAIDAMMKAADAGMYGSENREWALFNLGNIFLNQGKLDTAAFIFKGILEERPSYGFALSGKAMVEADKKDYGSAIADLVQAIQVMPEHMFFEQLSDLYFAMGDKRMTKEMEAKVLEAYKLHEADGWNINREYAAYCLNHNINLSESLDRAAKEYKTRPENIDALDTYAWALYKNSKASDAAPLIAKAMRLNTQNALIHYHAGMIYAANNNPTGAKQELSTALRINGYLNPIALGPAKSKLAELSGTASAN